MAATSTTNAWKNMKAKLGQLGSVTEAVIGEPKGGHISGMVMIMPMNGQVDGTVLNAPREKHFVELVRLENAIQDPVESAEVALEQWRAEILEDIFGDFDLGGTIAYPFPTETSWEWGHVQYGAILYRYLSIRVAFRLDVAARFVA